MDKSFFPKTDEWNEQVDRIPWLLNVCRLTILLSMFVLYMMSVFSENAGLKKNGAANRFLHFGPPFMPELPDFDCRPHWVRRKT